MIRDLLPHDESTDDPVTTAVRLMAVAKVFGRWAASISQDWTKDTRQLCLDLIEEITTNLEKASDAKELVVEERVRRGRHVLSPPTKKLIA